MAGACWARCEHAARVAHIHPGSVQCRDEDRGCGWSQVGRARSRNSSQTEAASRRPRACWAPAADADAPSQGLGCWSGATVKHGTSRSLLWNYGVATILTSRSVCAPKTCPIGKILILLLPFVDICPLGLFPDPAIRGGSHQPGSCRRYHGWNDAPHGLGAGRQDSRPGWRP